MRETAANPERKRRVALGACLVLSMLTFSAWPGICTASHQARLFITYMQATGCAEEPMGLVERITLSYLMAGQKAEKTKEAGARPASSGHRI